MPVLLFYWYCDVADPPSLVEQQRVLCESLGLTGRVRIASEGINATLGGSDASCVDYERALTADERFVGVDIKRSEGGSEDFEGLIVKQSKEIVTLGIAPDALSFKDGGTHLSPAEFRQELLERHDSDRGDSNGAAVVIDCRNAYESRIGCFDGALRPPTRQFSDFPAWCRENRSVLEGRRVLMYCTGGIRCERASAYLLGSDVEAATVGQLHGGIHRFLEEWPDGGGVWKGKNLVFDKRTAIGTTPPTRVPHAMCDLCDAEDCDDYSAGARCRYCRARLLVCPSCTVAPQSGSDSEAPTALSADGALCRECLSSAAKGELRKRAASTRDCWPHLREAGLGPPATCADTNVPTTSADEDAKHKSSTRRVKKKGPKPGGRRKVRLKYLRAMSSLLEQTGISNIQTGSPETTQQRQNQLDLHKEHVGAPWPQLSGVDTVDSALLCFFLLQPGRPNSDANDAVSHAAWHALLAPGCRLSQTLSDSIRQPEQISCATEPELQPEPEARAEDALDRFAATATPSSGCALLLWRKILAVQWAEVGLEAENEGDKLNARVQAQMMGVGAHESDVKKPMDTIPQRVLDEGAACLAMWKESDGRTIHRLYPAANDEIDGPLLGLEAARRLVRLLQEEWENPGIANTTRSTFHSFVGECYDGGSSACPKHQVQRLVREIRKQRY